ncbi:MAG: prenyltransferase, partial [Alphaproteobacteria bacterium]
MKEPTLSSVGGSSPGRVALRLFLATRPMFFPVAVLPVIVGTAWGARAAGGLDIVSFVLALAVIVLVNAGVNVLNDVCDSRNGGDAQNTGRIFPFTGGSRFIQNEIMTDGAMAGWALVLLASGCAVGLALVIQKGVLVLGFGLAGLAVGVLHSLPPVQLGARGLGEVTVAIGFGILPVVGAAWLQSGVWDMDVVVLSLPLALWAALILLINQVPDADADAAVGKRTLVTRLGWNTLGWLYLGLHIVAVAAIACLEGRGQLPIWSVVVPIMGLIGSRSAAADIMAAAEAPQRLRHGILITL